MPVIFTLKKRKGVIINGPVVWELFQKRNRVVALQVKLKLRCPESQSLQRVQSAIVINNAGQRAGLFGIDIPLIGYTDCTGTGIKTSQETNFHNSH